MNTVGACLLLAASTVPTELPVCEEDLDVFPPYEYVVYATKLAHDLMHEADAVRDKYYLTKNERCYVHHRYQDQYNRWYVWDDVKLAYEYKGDARLGVLHRLKARLGADAYYRGELPDCVSPWFGD